MPALQQRHIGALGAPRARGHDLVRPVASGADLQQGASLFLGVPHDGDLLGPAERVVQGDQPLAEGGRVLAQHRLHLPYRGASDVGVIGWTDSPARRSRSKAAMALPEGTALSWVSLGRSISAS